MSKRAVGGYAFNYEISKARQASGRAREALRRLLEDRPGPQTQAMLVAQIALAMGEIGAVLDEIERIGRSSTDLGTDKRTRTDGGNG